MVRINKAGLDLIKKFEGLRLKSYKCPGGKWTIGYGHTGQSIKSGQTITEHQADAILDVDVDKFERGVLAALDGHPVTENQFSALVSFAFNLGTAALARSSLLKKLKAGDIAGAAAEFMKWQYAAGKVLPGLLKRRAEERALFLTKVKSELD